MMSFGGNNRAHAFFKQHGWTDGGEIEAKYKSRAAELYKQVLSKEVAKSMAEDAGLPSSPIASQAPQAANGFSDFKVSESLKESSSGNPEVPKVSASPKASHTVVTTSLKKPLVAKKSAKTGGLGARKLTTKVPDLLNEGSFLCCNELANIMRFPLQQLIHLFLCFDSFFFLPHTA